MTASAIPTGTQQGRPGRRARDPRPRCWTRVAAGRKARSGLGAVAMRRAVLIDAGLFPAGRARLGGDRVLWLKVILRTPCTRYRRVTATWPTATATIAVTRKSLYRRLSAGGDQCGATLRAAEIAARLKRIFNEEAYGFVRRAWQRGLPIRAPTSPAISSPRHRGDMRDADHARLSAVDAGLGAPGCCGPCAGAIRPRDCGASGTSRRAVQRRKRRQGWRGSAPAAERPAGASPSVSVIIPTYNRRHSLPRSIESVLRQTYDDFGLIVVDDCSTDDTLAYLEKRCGSAAARHPAQCQQGRRGRAQHGHRGGARADRRLPGQRQVAGDEARPPDGSL